MRKKFLLILPVLFLISSSLFISLPKQALADTEESAVQIPQTVIVGKDETVNDNFIRAGKTVIVDGTINGDIIVAGETININADVKGDILAGGGTVNIKGTVAGNVRVAGGTVDIDAVIGKNLNAFGNTVNVSDNSVIGWSFLYGAKNVSIKGKINGNAFGGANDLIVSGKINGYLENFGSRKGTVTIAPQAVIKSNFTYHGKLDADIQQGAQISGITKHETTIIKSPNKDFWEFIGVSALLIELISLFGLLIVGMVIVSLFNKYAVRVTDYMKSNPGKSIGWGAIGLIATPLAMIILGLTFIGIPLALIIGALYLIALYASKIFFGLLVGRWLISLSRKDKKTEAPLLWAMVLGVILIEIITFIPIIGWLFGLVAIMWALGALVEIKKQDMKANNN